MTINLYEVQKRIIDCKTYNFGMHNADKLAHEDAPAMYKALYAVMSIHGQVFFDDNGRPSESVEGFGGWCTECGYFVGDGCITFKIATGL